MTNIIGIKQLYRELPKITKQVKKGKRFIVVNRSKPVFEIIPHEEEKKKKYTFKDLAKLKFKSGDPYLSEKVDEIVYGI